MLLLTPSGVTGAVPDIWDLDWITTGELKAEVKSDTTVELFGRPVRQIELTYLSEIWRGEEIRIAGHLAIPGNLKEGEKVPGIVWGHGHMGTGSMELATGEALALNAAVISIDSPGQGGSTGPRDSAYHWLNVADDPRDGYLYHYAVAAMRAITYLRTLPEVDGELIGIIGGSMGGIMTMLVNGVDPRVKVAISLIACGGWEDDMRDNNSWLNVLLLDPLGIGTDDIRFRRFIDYFDPINYAADQKGRLLIIVGAQDGFFPITGISKTARKLPPKDRLEVIYDFDHGGFRKYNEEDDTYDNSAEIDRRLNAEKFWWKLLSHNPPEIPEMPRAAMSVDGSTVTFSADVDAPERVERVLLCYSTDGSYTYTKVVMRPEDGRYTSSVILNDVERKRLCYFVEVEYRDPTFFLSSIPHLGPEFKLKIRPLNPGKEMIRREMRDEDAIALYEKEISDTTASLSERLWDEWRLGRFYFLSKKFDRAVETFESVISKSPSPYFEDVVPQSLLWEGLSLAQLGRRDEAIAKLERAMEIYPKCENFREKKLDEIKRHLAKMKLSR